jgi:D-serine dehydratase
MGLRLECIKIDEQQLLLENPLLKILLDDERSDWVNPIFDEREKCGEFHTLFPVLLEQASNFF